MALKSGIYQILNIETNERYIGSTKNFTARKASHLYDLRRKRNKHPKLQQAFDLYKETSFAFLILEYVQTNKERLLEREQYWINLLNPKYNENKLVGNVIPRSARTPEAIEKISNSVKELWENPEYRAKCSKPRNWKAGHPPNLGKKFPKETREKVSKAMTGKGNPNYGKPRSQPFLDKMQKTYDGAISPDGKVYSPIIGLNNFCKEHNLDNGQMSRLLNGKINLYKGWTKYSL